jgi:hypothetical protein
MAVISSPALTALTYSVVQFLGSIIDIQRIFDRLGYAPASRQEAEEMYRRLAGRGI